MCHTMMVQTVVNFSNHFPMSQRKWLGTGPQCFSLSNHTFFSQVECVEWLSIFLKLLNMLYFLTRHPTGSSPLSSNIRRATIRPNVRAGIIGPWQVESITTTAVISWSVLRALVLQASVSGCWAFSAFKKIPRLIYRRHISACHLSHIREGLGLFPCRFTRWYNTGVLQILGGVGDNEQMTLLLYTVTTTSWNLMHIWCRYDISKLFNAFGVFGCLNFM